MLALELICDLHYRPSVPLPKDVFLTHAFMHYQLARHSGCDIWLALTVINGRSIASEKFGLFFATWTIYWMISGVVFLEKNTIKISRGLESKLMQLNCFFSECIHTSYYFQNMNEGSRTSVGDEIPVVSGESKHRSLCEQVLTRFVQPLNWTPPVAARTDRKTPPDDASVGGSELRSSCLRLIYADLDLGCTFTQLVVSPYLRNMPFCYLCFSVCIHNTIRYRVPLLQLDLFDAGLSNG